ncbi:MAG: NADH-quinone oxidoreductase subunit M [Bacteroidetes bacterium]|nr:MAG: NADH-quinone oxidoreductase subunit M [Bacteroidota bacterium]
MNILLLLIIIPILTIIGILFTRDNKKVRVVSAIGMTFQLITAAIIIIWYLAERHAGNTAEVLFASNWVWYETLNIRFYIGVDGVSVAMIGLTAMVIFAGIFASWDVDDLPREFFTFLILLSSGVFGFFISLDLFTMFLFYEIAVIPMYLLIGIWGTGPRHYSAMKLTLMLMGGSALILLGMLGLYFNSNPDGGPFTFEILKIAKAHIPLNTQLFFFPFLFVGFGVLGALFPFHTWSPDGHASAPTAVSMLHAGVLMKLGGYGCYRVAIFLLPDAAHKLAWIFLILTTISVIYGALGAIWQKDLKYINAYSSVSHCGLVLFAILMFNETAMNGAIMQMISHGIMTALFFALIGMIYGRTHTRYINEMSGLMKVMPFLAVAYVIAGLASLGLPGFSGFVAEMTIFVGAFQHADTFHRVATIIAASSIVATAVYILRVVGMMLYGKINKEEYELITDAKWYDRLSVGTLIFGITAIGLAPLWLSTMITGGIGPVIEKLFLAMN